MRSPKAGTPFTKVEVPEGVVDPCRLPIEDPGELAVDGEQLALVDIAMYQDVRKAGGSVK
jgi:hypothetical protein